MTTRKQKTTTTTRRKLPQEAQPPHLPAEVSEALVKASCQGGIAVCAVLGAEITGMWISITDAIAVGRDNVVGDIVLRDGNGEHHVMVATDLASLAGMLMAAAVIQAHDERTTPR